MTGLPAGPGPEVLMQFLFALRSKGVTDKTVLTAMEGVDRGRFVKGIFAERAYDDLPLPIACGQTISQPSVVGIMMTADGSFGLPEQAPFDRILVTAAAEDPPPQLLAQLKPGGIMIVPVGQSDHVQTLIRVRRFDDGYDYEEIRPVRFVPLLEGLAKDR